MSGTRDDEQWRRLRRRALTIGGNGVNVSVTLAATSKAVVFARTEVDALYGVVITPSWLTTHAVTAKATTGFTVTFGTGAPANATFDFITHRTES